MLTHIYIVNQWFYNKPYVMEIGNSQWDVLSVIYPKYQHVLQQIDILKLDRDNEAICLNRYAVQGQIGVLNLMYDRLSNQSVANAHDCGIDVCGTLSQDASILNNAAASIIVSDRFSSVQNAIQQDLNNLNNVFAAYNSIYDYINQVFSAGGNSSTGPQILVSMDNQTRQGYSIFFTNVENLVNQSYSTINNGLSAIYQNTYAVPNNLWKNADFQLPLITLANQEQMVNCTNGLTQWAQQNAAQVAANSASNSSAGNSKSNNSSSGNLTSSNST